MAHYAMNRRMFLLAIGGFFASRVVTLGGEKNEDAKETERQLKELAKFVHPDKKWGCKELPEILEKLPNDSMLQLMKSLGLRKESDKVADLAPRSKDVRAVLVHFRWISHHSLLAKFVDPYEIDYHNIVEWVAEKHNVPAASIKGKSTFEVEQAILVKVFEGIWDKLNPQQRLQLLNTIDKKGALTDKEKAGLTAEGGAAAIAALAAIVNYSGFAFYTTMSTVVATVAGFFGFTLPFGVYQSLSSFIALLSGPLGWILAGILGAVGLALFGGADPEKTRNFICQIHLIKAQALEAAGVKVETNIPINRAKK